MLKLKRRWWRPVSDYAERELASFLYEGAGSPDLFLEPAGEPSLVPADRMSARIYASPLTVYMGGIGAVILELAEPRVRHGVWDHSVFPTDPLLRLRRTGLAAMVTFYGAQSTARRMIAEVNAKHAKVSGKTDRGVAYQALDQDLLMWVQATAAYGFIGAFHAYAEELSVDQWDQTLREAQPVAKCYGVNEPPMSKGALDALITSTLPTLEPSDTLTEFVRIMRETPTLPPPAHHLQPLFVKAAISILPSGVRAQLGLAHLSLSPPERYMVLMFVRGSRLVSLRNHPASLSAVRQRKTAD